MQTWKHYSISKKNNANLGTLQHIQVVRNMLNKVIIELIVRAENHNQSKLCEPELSYFSTRVNTLSTMEQVTAISMSKIARVSLLK